MPILHPTYGWRIVRTSAVLWALIRLVLVLISWTFLLATGASLVLIAAVVLLCWFDGRRFNEHLFHQNLGTPVSLGVTISFLIATTLEVGAMLLFRSLGG